MPVSSPGRAARRVLLAALPVAFAAAVPAAELAPPPRVLGPADLDRKLIAEVRQRSEIMANLRTLCDDIGPRLTGSPNLERANRWAADRMTAAGLTNVRLEPWEIPVGWERGPLSFRLIGPGGRPLLAAAAGWTPGTDGPVTGPVVAVTIRTKADLATYRGKLRGAVVMRGDPADVKPITDTTYGPPPAPPGPKDAPKKDALRPKDAPPKTALPKDAPPKIRPAGVPAGGRGLPQGRGRGRRPARRGQAARAASYDRDVARGRPWHATRAAADAVRRPRALRLIAPPAGPTRRRAAAGGSRGVEPDHPRPADGVQHGRRGDRLGEAGRVRRGRGAPGFVGPGERGDGQRHRLVRGAGGRPRRRRAGEAGVPAEADGPVRAVYRARNKALHGSKQYAKRHANELPKTSAAMVHDTGTGKVKGLGMQGRLAVKTVLEPELDALKGLDGWTGLDLGGMGGTDHLSFEAAGVPGFACRQDMDEYRLTHHTQSDTFDKAKEPNLIEGAQVLAVVAERVANLPALLPREKPPEKK